MHNYTLNPPGAPARDTQNTDHVFPKPPPPGTKPFLWKTEPIVRLRTDDGKVYLEQFHNLRGVYDEEEQSLSVKTPDGMITATGPGAWEVCEHLCAGKVTMIRSDGVQITEVGFIPDEDENVEL
jgi:hypothetical protein